MGKSGSWALVAALAGFLFGFDTAVISGAEQAVQAEWSMSDLLHGLAISAALWGTVIGALTAGWPLDRFGRKKTLVWIGILYALSAIGSALAWDPSSFMIFRFIGGLGVGASSVAAPAYIAEIAPGKVRGRLVALFQTMIVLGILIAYLSNYLLGGIGAEAWRWMLGAEVLPAIAYLLATFAIPESPRWLLVTRGEENAARDILHRINPATVDETIVAIKEEARREKRQISWGEFFSGTLKRPIFLAFLIAFFNQVSGINAIIYYAPRIFELSGSGASVALLATVGIGAINLLFTLIGLALIDRAGRKFLMYLGSVGYIISLGMTAYGFASGQFALVLPFILMFIAAHAIGQGAVIWVYISEIFPSAARAKGQSLGAGTHWVFAAALTLVMPSILASVAPSTIFLAFGAMMVLQLVWVHFAMFETRGRSLEDISRESSAASLG
ncbi:sugar porter family MFS transporter [Aurantiacibacter rhizosphaerae]|uniref:Sugar porter family MFS transporter n=1 Tax=Aurantiacibacter rhizosphaerae TaxID=2691582 RepID=A0A844X9T9_9SPHN|nr:sugar porter family MFS transporter [Aurantiacibacter rhizosphaerae]MWV26444.1 sugar porter family MFS transporter [Aurantiacibacter rhizosphaerae]